jgi:hypothetical protein
MGTDTDYSVTFSGNLSLSRVMTGQRLDVTTDFFQVLIYSTSTNFFPSNWRYMNTGTERQSSSNPQFSLFTIQSCVSQFAIVDTNITVMASYWALLYYPKVWGQVGLLGESALFLKYVGRTTNFRTEFFVLFRWNEMTRRETLQFAYTVTYNGWNMNCYCVISVVINNQNGENWYSAE